MTKEPIHDTKPRSTATSQMEGRMKTEMGPKAITKKRRKFIKKVVKTSMIKSCV